VRLTTRRGDDADLIRARLRALLAVEGPAGGWLPEEQPEDRWPASADHDDDRGTVPVEADDPPGLPGGVGRHRAPGTAVRWGAGAPGARALWAAAVTTVLLVVGWTWLERPRVEPPPGASAAAPTGEAPEQTAPVGEAAPTPSTVVVSVVGEVARPGLVTLPPGARVADAVAAAGGLLPEAEPATVNLAAPLTDGQQIAVGAPGGVPPAGGGAGGAGLGAPAGRVDLNTAGVADLDALPGIGPVLAQRIVDHRARHGGFGSVAELDDVPGIGPAKAAELAELVAV
jgi:competence protein ComEA